MTFDKYNGDHSENPYSNTVFPDDGYLYDYKVIKGLGWCQIRGDRIEDLPQQEWSTKTPYLNEV